MNPNPTPAPQNAPVPQLRALVAEILRTGKSWEFEIPVYSVERCERLVLDYVAAHAPAQPVPAADEQDWKALDRAVSINVGLKLAGGNLTNDDQYRHEAEKLVAHYRARATAPLLAKIAALEKDKAQLDALLGVWENAQIGITSSRDGARLYTLASEEHDKIDAAFIDAERRSARSAKPEGGR